MKSKFKIKLAPGEFIETAFASPASGPGWVNCPIVVIIGHGSGKMRLEGIQPEQMTPEMVSILGFSALAHQKMSAEVKAVSVQEKMKEGEK